MDGGCCRCPVILWTCLWPKVCSLWSKVSVCLNFQRGSHTHTFGDRLLYPQQQLHTFGFATAITQSQVRQSVLPGIRVCPVRRSFVGWSPVGHRNCNSLPPPVQQSAGVVGCRFCFCSCCRQFRYTLWCAVRGGQLHARWLSVHEVVVRFIGLLCREPGGHSVTESSFSLPQETCFQLLWHLCDHV